MAHAGDVIENPLSGERITFERTGAETDGQYLAGKIYLAPRGVGPPEHVHPRITEEFRVISGTLSARLAGRPQTFGPGGHFVVSPQKTIMLILRPLARMLGYPSEYPYPYDRPTRS